MWDRRPGDRPPAWLTARSTAVMGLRVASSIAVALVVLDVAARLLRAQEFNEARAMVLGRLQWPKRRA